jgi:superfamily II DNA or RNA helicase
MAETTRRRLSRAEREALFVRANGHCERCGLEIKLESFHVAHLRAQAHGGPTVLENVQAWCARCNWTQAARDVEDTRVVPREWQLEALSVIVERIAQMGAATVAAAPGAGKTVFAALVFEQLRDAGLVDRMVVLTPNRTLVEQWHDKVLRQRHLELAPGRSVEIPGQVGVVVTYQSLGPTTLETHRRLAAHARTLVVLDEVHHVGERDDTTRRLPAWTRYVRELIGVVDHSLHVAGVLNLSGTLWRSNKGERISTVRYLEEDDGRVLSQVDYEVTTERLIQEGELRPVDLYRLRATVELIDLAEGTLTVSPIAELNDGQGLTAGALGAVLRGLARDPNWQKSLADGVLERLEKAYRDLGKGPAKALIVAPLTSEARAFKAAADTAMRARGLVPLTDVAVSADGEEAARVLKHFKKMNRPGVLSTVNMASEGYDCAEISVIGWATDKRTPLYVRQVVARAQRVTEYERQVLKRPIPAAVVIPDVPEIVELMRAILRPMRHELEPIEEGGDGPGGHRDPRYYVDDVRDFVDGDAHVTGTDDGDVRMDHIRAVEPHFRRVGLPETEVARAIVAVRGGTRDWRDQDHFRPLAPDDADVAAAGATPRPGPEAARTEPLSKERTNALLRVHLRKRTGWWVAHVKPEIYPLSHFQADCNRAGGIARGERDSATPEQLYAAITYASSRIRQHCEETGQAPPDWLDDGDEA